MDCPNCGGECYDNSERVANGWKGPLFKCKDQDGCGWKKFAPKGQKGGQRQNGNGGGSAPVATARSTRPLGPIYYSCMKVAQATVAQLIGDKATPADIVAATATLFIQAAQTGAPITQPKQKAVAPPPPKPEPEYEEEEDDGLPF